MNDFISREAAKKLICRRCGSPNGCKDQEFCPFICDLNDIPAADVRPVVRGKWIEHNYDPEYLSCDFSCSKCNVYLEEYYFGEGQWPGKTDHYFCPNCGADMRGEK